MARPAASVLILFSAVFVLVLAAGTVARAAELDGVKVADSVTVGAKTLVLNGLGARTKFFINIYIGALYLEKPSSDAAAIIASEQVKRMRMTITHALEVQKVREAFQTALVRNAGGSLSPAVETRIAPFFNSLRSTRVGDVVDVTYTPGVGTVVTTNGVEDVKLEGSDLARLIFSIWLGTDPADAGLKKGVLRGSAKP